MKPLVGPFIKLVWRKPLLRRGTIICVSLALVSSAAEVAVAVSLVPILASLGVDAGGDLSGVVSRISPAAWIGIFAVLAAVRSVVNWLSSVQDEHSTQELVVSLQSRLYRALATAHWDAVRHLAPPTITSALQTQAYDAGFGFGNMVQVISATLLVLAYIISATIVFPALLPVLLVVLAVMWLLNGQRSSKVLIQAEDYHEAQTELHQRYEDWVAISRISSLGVDAERIADRFETGAREAAFHAVGFSRSTAATRIGYEAALVLAILIGVPFAWWQETPPALLAFGLLIIVRVLPRAAGIHTGYQGIVNAVAPVLALESLAARLESDPIEPLADTTPLSWKHLALSSVGVEDTTRDGGRRWILRDASIGLKHGEWLALRGPTGAGKTTLAEVLLMLVRPDAGKLRIDDQIVDDAMAGRWRAQAAYVPQDVVLFDASIRANLRLYVPDAQDEELEDALSKAAADFVMTRLPEGLGTRVGPGGRWLSGGERQRIGIARALLRRPGFLVLDEPTAALDGVTQARLMDALGRLEHTMSVVLITHRPELLRLVDRVIEIKDGVLQSSGPDPRHP